MKKIICTVVVLFFLFPVQAMAVAKRTTKNNHDKVRIDNIVMMGKMIEYFYKQTGYYPMRPPKLGTRNIVFITDNTDNIPDNALSYKALQEELFAVLGPMAVLFKDPDEIKKEAGRAYRYITNGQAYWLSAFLDVEKHYTKISKFGFYKVEISSRPSTNKFHYSVRYIERFAKNGADNKRMQKSLFEALEDKNYEWADGLVKEGANLSPMCGYNHNCQPLARAARAGDVEKIKFLLSHGADINGFNAYYDVALIKALEVNEAEAVKTLVDFGADVNVPNSKGMTPFLKAISAGMYDIVKLMLKNGADSDRHYLVHRTNFKDMYVGMRPLEAAIQSENVGIVKLLLDKGADVHLATVKNTSLLDYARTFKNKKIILMLEQAIKN